MMLASQDRISAWNKAAFAVAMLLPSATVAQQQPSPNEQAMGAKLMQEIQGGLNCSANLIGVQAELAKAQARIKELEAKAEDKK